MQSSIDLRYRALLDLSDRLAARAYLLAFGLGVVFAMLGFQYLQNRLGAPMLDMMLGYDREELVERLLYYGEEGRLLHARFTLFLDMVFPVIYGGFLGGLIRLVTRGTRAEASLLAVLFVMLIDWAENLQIIALLWGFPDFSDAQIMAAAATTQGKTWAFQAIFLGLVAVSVYRLYRRLKA